jgi:hypothetical protein
LAQQTKFDSEPLIWPDLHDTHGSMEREAVAGSQDSVVVTVACRPAALGAGAEVATETNKRLSATATQFTCFFHVSAERLSL